MMEDAPPPMEQGGTTRLQRLIGSPIRLVTIGLLLVVIFAIGHQVPDRWLLADVLLEIARDAGIALLIAAAIITTIELKADERRKKMMEHFQKSAADQLVSLKNKSEELIREMSEKSLEFYFQRALPDGWFEYIKKEIEDSTFLRRNLRVRADLNWPHNKETEEEYLILNLTISYNVRNISGKDDVFDILAFIEFPYNDALRHVADVNQVEIDGDPLTEEEIEKGKNLREDSHIHRKFCHPRRLARGEEINVRVSLTTARLPADRFVWITEHPSEGIEGEFTVADGLIGFISILHPDCSDLPTKMVTPRKAVSMGTTRPVMRMGGIELAWAKEEIVGKAFRPEEKSEPEEVSAGTK